MLSNLFRNLKNIPGSKTRRKIVVFNVDDYGSVRVKNRDAYSILNNSGIPMNQTRFTQYDTLADKEDMTLLFETLTSVKDSNHRNACFTAFVPVANPDFEKIKASAYSKYYREPFTKTLQRYGKYYEGVFELWKQGITDNIFYPAYHGTEHVNVKRFMESLQNGQESVRLAFDNESVCVPSLPGEPPAHHATSTFYIEKPEENEQLKKDIVVGTKLFSELFGYKSKQFIPGAGIYSLILNKTLSENGIKYIHVSRFYAYPLGDGKYNKRFFYNGKQNAFGQKYILRNCEFEPDGQKGNLVANRCLTDIETAFRWRAPAIITSHRVNFVGHFNKEHRDNSLSQLSYLLANIVKRWPDVEFMNADEMADAVL